MILSTTNGTRTITKSRSKPSYKHSVALSERTHTIRNRIPFSNKQHTNTTLVSVLKKVFTSLEVIMKKGSLVTNLGSSNAQYNLMMRK